MTKASNRTIQARAHPTIGTASTKASEASTRKTPPRIWAKLKIGTQLLKDQHVGRIATASKTGVPHVVPVCFVYDGKAIYIPTYYGTGKMKNLRQNPHVAFVVDEYNDDWMKIKGVLIPGEAEILDSGEEYQYAKKLIYEKYPQYNEFPIPMEEKKVPVIKIHVDKIIEWNPETVNQEVENYVRKGQPAHVTS